MTGGMEIGVVSVPDPPSPTVYKSTVVLQVHISRGLYCSKKLIQNNEKRRETKSGFERSIVPLRP